MPAYDAAECMGPEQQADLALNKQVCFALYLSANKVSRLYRPLLEPYGLTYSQYLALIALWENAPCSVGHLCHALDLESSTVTPLLKRMEVLGYITRTRDRVDERRVEIALTAKAKAFKADAATIRSRLASQVGLPSAMLVDLRRALQELSGAIDRHFTALP